MAAPAPDERCLVLLVKTYLELRKMQQATIRGQHCHLQLTEPHSYRAQNHFELLFSLAYIVMKRLFLDFASKSSPEV